MEGSWFRHKSVGGIICITEPCYADTCNIWFFETLECFVCVDCGTGACDLHAFLMQEKLINDEKPLFVICTHRHNDHAGGLRHFVGKAVICAHSEEKAAIEGGEDEVKWANLQRSWKKSPFEGFVAKEFEAMKKGIKIDKELNDGDTLCDLTVIHLPGHTPGCIALLETKKRWLFTGDMCYEGIPIDNFPSSDIQQLCNSMRRLRSYSKDFDIAFPGHFHCLTSEEVVQVCDMYVSMKGSKQKE